MNDEKILLLQIIKKSLSLIAEAVLIYVKFY